MNQSATGRHRTPFATLRRLAQRISPGPVQERCELCGMEVEARHRHLLEMANRQLVCSCDACGLRFERVVGGRFKLIPRDVRLLPDFHMSDELWESLALPIELAFIFTDSRTNKPSALYPSPAGATESLLPMSAWDLWLAENPPLAQLEADVEALLINRVGAARAYFIVPIDRCYELVGIIRTHWRGLSGGDAVGRELENYFQRLRAEAGLATEEEVSHA